MTDIHTLDKAHLVHEVQYKEALGHAVAQGRRSDFALMLALLSGDVNETAPTDASPEEIKTDDQLRQQFQLPPSSRLTAEDVDYQLCAEQANAFHQGGIASAKFRDCVNPSALHFPTAGTAGLPELVYHNLSGHQRRQLTEKSGQPFSLNPTKLYNQLVISKRYQSARATV